MDLLGKKDFLENSVDVDGLYVLYDFSRAEIGQVEHVLNVELEQLATCF